MRRLAALGAVVLVGFLGAAMAAPSPELGLPVPAITEITHADAAIGRGGGGGEGGQPSVIANGAKWLQSEIVAGFFIAVAIGLSIPVFQRNAGAAVAILVAALVIGAFVLVPDQVEGLFRSIYLIIL